MVSFARQTFLIPTAASHNGEVDLIGSHGVRPIFCIAGKALSSEAVRRNENSIFDNARRRLIAAVEETTPEGMPASYHKMVKSRLDELFSMFIRFKYVKEREVTSLAAMQAQLTAAGKEIPEYLPDLDGAQVVVMEFLYPVNHKMGYSKKKYSSVFKASVTPRMVLPIHLMGLFHKYLNFLTEEICQYSEGDVKAIVLESSSNYSNKIVLHTNKEIKGLSFVPGDVSISEQKASYMKSAPGARHMTSKPYIPLQFGTSTIAPAYILHAGVKEGRPVFNLSTVSIGSGLSNTIIVMSPKDIASRVIEKGKNYQFIKLPRLEQYGALAISLYSPDVNRGNTALTIDDVLKVAGDYEITTKDIVAYPEAIVKTEGKYWHAFRVECGTPQAAEDLKQELRKNSNLAMHIIVEGSFIYFREYDRNFKARPVKRLRNLVLLGAAQIIPTVDELGLKLEYGIYHRSTYIPQSELPIYKTIRYNTYNTMAEHEDMHPSWKVGPPIGTVRFDNNCITVNTYNAFLSKGTQKLF